MSEERAISDSILDGTLHALSLASPGSELERDIIKQTLNDALAQGRREGEAAAKLAMFQMLDTMAYSAHQTNERKARYLDEAARAVRDSLAR